MQQIQFSVPEEETLAVERVRASVDEVEHDRGEE